MDFINSAFASRIHFCFSIAHNIKLFLTKAAKTTSSSKQSRICCDMRAEFFNIIYMINEGGKWK